MAMPLAENDLRGYNLYTWESTIRPKYIEYLKKNYFI